MNMEQLYINNLVTDPIWAIISTEKIKKYELQSDHLKVSGHKHSAGRALGKKAGFDQ